MPSDLELIAYQEAIDHFIQESKRIKLSDETIGDPTELDLRVEAGPAIGLLLLKSAISIGAGLLLNFVASKILSANKKDKTPEQKKFAPNYGFDEGGAIPDPAQLVPMIYCNRRVNPYGGVRAAGYLLHSRIETLLGASTLYQLHVLGMGQIGEINTNKALIAEQPRDLYSDRDVSIQSRSGTSDQTAIDWFPFFSQVVSPANYNTFGVDYRTKFKQVASVGIQSVTGGTFNDQTLIQTAPPTAAVMTANAYAPITIGTATGTIGSGRMQTQPIDAANGDARMGIVIEGGLTDFIRIFNGTWQIWQSNVQVANVGGGVTIGAVITLKIELIQTGFGSQAVRSIKLTYSIDNIPIYAYTLPVQTVQLAWILNVGISMYGITAAIGEAWQPINSTTYKVGTDDYDVMDSGDEYMVGGEPTEPPTLFAIASKNEADKSITIDPAYNFGTGDTPLYAYWRAKYETTRPVTRLDLNLVLNLTSTNKNGESLPFGSAFDLYIGDIGTTSSPDDFLSTTPPTLWRVVRFFCRADNPNGIRRQIQIRNLPFGRYRIELRPIPPGGIQAAIELGDNGTLSVYPYTIPIAGALTQIQIFCESKGLVPFDSITSLTSETDRLQMSSDNGATGRLTSVNEIIEPATIGLAIPNYANLALHAARLKASQRLSQPPTTEALIVQGIVCWNWIKAGKATVTGSFANVNESFVGIFAGWTLFNLDRKTSAIITNVQANSLTTSPELSWTAGDRYAIAFKNASNYFPDIFVDILRRKSSEGGLGSLFDADRLIDYESIVNARNFCAAKGFYFDDTIVQSQGFTAWAEQTARLSMLMCTTVGSRLGLRPIRNDAPVMTINGANCRNFNFQAADWIDHQINTVVVKHRDGRSDRTSAGLRFRPTTTTIQTTAARNNLVPVSKVEVEASSVSSPNQIKAIGCYTLRSSTLQDCTCSFELDWVASYLQPGDIIRAQTESLILRDELSGLIKEIDSDKSFTLTREPLLLRGEFDNSVPTTRSTLNCNTKGIQLGDLIRIRRTNNSLSEPSHIVSVSDTQLVFDPPIRADAYAEYEILDITFDGLFASVTIDRTNFDNCPIAFSKYKNGKVWISTPTVAVTEGCPTIVYRKDSRITLWQINTMEPIAGYGAKVSCVLWNPAITDDWTGLWIKTSDGEYQN